MLICHVPEQNNGIFRYRERTFSLHIVNELYTITNNYFTGDKIVVDRNTGQITMDTGDGFMVYGHCQPADKKKF